MYYTNDFFFQTTYDRQLNKKTTFNDFIVWFINVCPWIICKDHHHKFWDKLLINWKMKNEKTIPISDSTNAIVFTNHEKQSYIMKVRNK